MNSIAERLKGCFQAVFPDAKNQELESFEAATCAEWDSMAMVMIVNLVEEEFDITIRAEDVVELLTFAKFVDYIAARVRS